MVGANKRVLEIGAASGHVTRALKAQHCRVTAIEYDPQAAADIHGIAERVVVGDLNDPATLGGLAPDFEVALAGDVLEHLLDPQAVLNQMAQLLVPGGRVVISLPHIAHVDVRLALLQGRFDYHPWGLLDQTHLRFFTLKTIRDLVGKAGLVIVDMARVRIPAFESELAVDRLSVSTEVVEQILNDPEAETYQFVFAAIRDDGEYRTSQFASRLDELQRDAERQAIVSATQIAGLTRDLADGRQRLHEAEQRLREAEESLRSTHSTLAAARDQLSALRATRTFRYTAWPRSFYGAIRRGRS
jgi:SAM-dependent methyltransferase